MPNATAQVLKATDPLPKKHGRPRNRFPKEVIKASVSTAVAAEGRKIAFRNGESFSAFVARALHDKVLKST